MPLFLGCSGCFDPFLDLVNNGDLIAQLILLIDVQQVLEELAGLLQSTQGGNGQEAGLLDRSHPLFGNTQCRECLDLVTGCRYHSWEAYRTGEHAGSRGQ